MITYIFNKIHFKDLTLLVILMALLCGFIKKTVYVLIIVILHEIGHLLVCFLFNYKVDKVEIYPFGGITKIDKHLNDSIYHDLLLASGGIIVQSIIYFMGYFRLINNSFFLDLNYKILLFNLIPIIPLDGSKIIFELLNKFFSFYRALNIYTIVSFVMIIVFIIYNKNNLIDCYVIIGLFIQKTIDIYKNKDILFHKFILERRLYHLKFGKIKNINQSIKNYQKDVKYFYNINSKMVDEYDYLKSILL